LNPSQVFRKFHLQNAQTERRYYCKGLEVNYFFSGSNTDMAKEALWLDEDNKEFGMVG
jgi:hypothetical protein